MLSKKTRSAAPITPGAPGSYSPAVSPRSATPAAVWPRRLLVCSDGTLDSDAGILAARELAARTGASAEIVVVHVPRMAVPAIPSRRGFDRCESPERNLAARLLRAVRAQCREHLSQPRSWPLRLEVGDPVAVIARVAEESDAGLVVLGIGRPDPAERRQGGRTAVFAARQLTVPLYAAARGCEAPSRCVVVLPDGRAHGPTIRNALACMPRRGSVWIALPGARPDESTADRETGSARDILLRACGAAMADRLATLDCQRTDIEGDMLTGVLQLADEVQAQLVAVPVHGMPGPVRTFLPNIAEPLLLTARCSVLTAPDETAAGRSPRGTTHD